MVVGNFTNEGWCPVLTTWHLMYSFFFVSSMFYSKVMLGFGFTHFAACLSILQVVVEVHSCDMSGVGIIGFLWMSGEW